MVFFNYTTMEMSAKIVFYGPGLCGKTTNLQYIYNHIPGNRRGEMVSLPTETDRTLFFDLLPLRLGKIGGFTTRLQLYTVPGQVFYNSTRKLVLKGVDSIVFVADSQTPMLDANIESLENLQENLAELKLNLRKIPWVIQYNKRDLKNVMSVKELEKKLNTMNVPYFEASAITGQGVIETLKGISKLTLQYLKRKAGYASIDKVADEEKAKSATSVKSSKESETVPKPARPIDTAGPVTGKVAPELVHTTFEADGTLIQEVSQSIAIPIHVDPNNIPRDLKIKMNLELDLTFIDKKTGEKIGQRRMEKTISSHKG